MHLLRGIFYTKSIAIIHFEHENLFKQDLIVHVQIILNIFKWMKFHIICMAYIILSIAYGYIYRPSHDLHYYLKISFYEQNYKCKYTHNKKRVVVVCLFRHFSEFRFFAVHLMQKNYILCALYVACLKQSVNIWTIIFFKYWYNA